MLHVLRYRRDELDRLIDDINATGYGLTFGLHTRIDETIARVVERVEAGNVYVNRNIIGAVVGVQPFGGPGLSGTGPKAGGPLYLERLLSRIPPGSASPPPRPRQATSPAAPPSPLAGRTRKHHGSRRCRSYIERSPTGTVLTLPGPVGERNLYRVHARGTVLCLPDRNRPAAPDRSSPRHRQQGADPGNQPLPDDLPKHLQSHITITPDWTTTPKFQAVLFEGDSDALRDLNRKLATRPGAIVSAQGISRDALASCSQDYRLAPLVEETVRQHRHGGSGRQRQPDVHRLSN